MRSVLFAGLTACLIPLTALANPCHVQGVRATVVVDTERALLHLCLGGEIASSHRVNLGQGGLGKTRQGDKKTPTGTYRLDPPRASFSGFTWFVPVGYPTSSQRERGFTGGAIGIHGPPDWLPQWVIDAAFDQPWTEGCIMVRTKSEIETISNWIRTQRPETISIVPPSGR